MHPLLILTAFPENAIAEVDGLHPWLRFALALALTFGLGAAAFAVVQRLAPHWPLAGWAAGLGLGACVVIAPRELLLAPAIVATVWFSMFLKLTEWARRRAAGEPPLPPRTWLPALLPFPVFWPEMGRPAAPPPARRRTAWLRTVAGAAVMAAGFAAIIVLSRVEALQQSFLLDHTLKVGLLLVVAESLAQMLYGLEMLAGYDVGPLVNWVMLSRTPAEFWTRWNYRVHRWLHRNIFEPAGGRRHLVRAVACTFLVSGLLHELGFGLPTRHIDGYQTVFFLLQIPGVLASSALERFARRNGVAGDLLARLVTILWMGATAVFFFRSVERVFPWFYAAKPWLP